MNPSTVIVFVSALGVVSACRSEKPTAPVAMDAQQKRSEPAEKPRVVIRDIAIQQEGKNQTAEIYPRQLAKRVGQLLLHSGVFHKHSDTTTKQDHHLATVQIALNHQVVRRGPKAVVVVVVQAEVIWQDGSTRLAPHENVILERVLERSAKDVNGFVAIQAEKAVITAAQGLVRKEVLRIAQDSDVLKTLESGQADDIVWALSIVRERRLASAVDVSIQLLGSANPEIQDEAFRTLVALRDRRAVDALTKYADFKNPERMHSVIEALSVLGGADALEFLDFVATGHPKLPIRKHALEAQKRLQQKPPRAE